MVSGEEEDDAEEDDGDADDERSADAENLEDQEVPTQRRSIFDDTKDAADDSVEWMTTILLLLFA